MQPATATQTLVDAQWLEDHLDDPAVQIIEVDVSGKAYEEGHIPGAVLWNIYRDMRDGGYQLLPTGDFEQLIRDSGITDKTTIVFYGYAPAIGFFMMHHFGHADLRILDADRASWQRDGRPWTRKHPKVEATTYRIGEGFRETRASKAQVRGSITVAGELILDVRSRGEYEGTQFWPSGGMQPGGRAGHIPSAIHVPADGLTADDGAFRSIEDIQEMFRQVERDQRVTTYCTVGARAATVWFVLTHLLGYDDVRVYDGSWAEWGLDPDTPIDSGQPRSSR